MRTMILLLVVMVAALGFARDPIGNEENHILYGWDGFTYEVQQSNMGFVSYSQTVNGADSVAVWFDVATATYDFWDVYVSAFVTAEVVDGSEDDIAEFRWYDQQSYTSATAADTLNWTGFNSADTDFGKLYYTVVTTSAARTASKLITSLVPGERYVCPIQFRCDETVATDSAGYMFEVITVDSCEVNITIIAIPRI